MSSINSTSVQRKRRRIPKSCQACRVKKLKCDRVRPRCSSCIIRQIIDCQYEEDTLGENIRKMPPTKTQDGSSGPSQPISIPSPSNKNINPFVSMTYIHKVPRLGRVMVQGPTSLKSFVTNIHHPFTIKFEHLWRKTEPERLLWRDEHKEQLEKSNPVYDINESLLGSQTSVIEISAALPDYKTLVKNMNEFFSDSPLYDINTILSKDETMEFFYTAFIPDDGNNNKESSKIWKFQDRLTKKIGMPLNSKHYKLGILLMINRLVHCKDYIDPRIEIFLNQLENQNQFSGAFIVQCQFLLLRWYHRRLYFTKIDDINLLNLVSHIIDIAMTLGLQLDIDKTYSHDTHIDLQMLKNMWYWIQFADLSISFQFGRPLKINSKCYRNFSYDNDSASKSNFIKKLHRFLIVVRDCYDVIYDQSTYPNLPASCKQITNLLMIEFPNMSDYFNDRSKYDWKNNLSELRILTLGLGVLISIYGLRFKITGDRTIRSKNSYIQTTLISFNLITDTLENCWKYDNEIFPDLVESSGSLTPYLNMAISLSEGLFQRAHMNFMSLIYYKVTLFNEGSFRPYDFEPLDWNLDTLETRDDKVITLVSTFNIYTDIFSRWRRPEVHDMKQVLKRSYPYFLMILLEKISRMIVEKVIRFRQKSEEAIKNVNNGLNEPATPTDSQTTSSIGTPQDEEQLNSQVADEFWGTFNGYWEELLKHDYKSSQDFT